MAITNPLQATYIKSLIKKFLDSPSKTLARKAYKERPELFSSIESARKRICYYRGLCGNANREKLADKSFAKEPYKYNPYNLPESHANPFEPFEIKQSKTLLISDLHFPYQHNKAIELALDYGKKKNVNCILINGDVIDFATISKHENDWRNRSVYEEFEAVRQFLRELRKAFPKVKIVLKLGNHCERWEKWLFLKAPEIFDDPEFRLESRLRLGELGIDIVKDKRPIKIGKLTVLHGHELAGGSGGVNPARATFLKTLDSVVVGHYHKTSSHVETTMNGSVVSVESVGCLCGMNPYYMPINKWNLGFGYVECDLKTGEYQFYNKKIIKGKIY